MNRRACPSAPRTTGGQGRPAFCPPTPATAARPCLTWLRATEYSYLDAGAHVYLDYTGAGLPAQAQLCAHAERVNGRCWGNPH